MRGHAGVFARQDAALVGDILAEQVGVLEVQRIGGEIDLGFRARRAIFRRARTAFISVGMGFAGHNYLISRCTVWRRKAGLYFFISSFSVFNFLFRVVE